MLGIVIWGLIAISGGILGAILAGWKNRDVSAWAAWCFLVPPLALALLVGPKRQGPRPRRPSLDEEDRYSGGW
jgi:uncharacterized membrane protein YfcA